MLGTRIQCCRLFFLTFTIHCLLGGLRLVDLNERNKVLFRTFSGAVVAVLFAVFTFSSFYIFFVVVILHTVRIMQKILMTKSRG